MSSLTFSFAEKKISVNGQLEVLSSIDLHALEKITDNNMKFLPMQIRA